MGEIRNAQKKRRDDDDVGENPILQRLEAVAGK